MAKAHFHSEVEFIMVSLNKIIRKNMYYKEFNCDKQNSIKLSKLEFIHFICFIE